MTAGRRDQLVTIERFTATTDDWGQAAESWAEFAQEWSAVFYGRGDERRQAAMEQGQQSATFQMLANLSTLGVTLKDRLNGVGSLWDIVGVAPDTPKRGLIEFTAVRSL